MIELVDLEATPQGCIGFAAREARMRLREGMFARVVLTDPEVSRRGERVWLKIMSVHDRHADFRDPEVVYKGELVSDTYFDLAFGAEFTFGPEHVCEWVTVQP